MNDKDYMMLAISLAAQGCGYVNPNPLVGAVIVKNGRIIGQGYHKMYGQLHAERNALASCSESASGATMYVTLEPCCHYGKTAPCTEAIIKSHISRVVIGSRDPNPMVSGKGVLELENAGIEVVTDFIKDECDKINEIFFHYITKGSPLVTMKYAMTMDGKIATSIGKSRWITGETARRHVHTARGRNMAIMVGVGTVIADDPALTARNGGGPDPIRIICDTSLRTPLSAKVIGTGSIIFTCSNDPVKVKAYEVSGTEVICVDSDEAGHPDLRTIINILGEKKIDSVIIEGGSTLNWSALKAGIVDKVQAYIAPKIFGGECAKGPIDGPGVLLPSNAFKLKNTKLTELDGDYLLESEVLKCLQE